MPRLPEIPIRPKHGRIPVLLGDRSIGFVEIGEELAIDALTGVRQLTLMPLITGSEPDKINAFRIGEVTAVSVSTNHARCG